MAEHIYLRLEDVKGEATGKAYSGEFKLLKFISNRQRSEVARYLEHLSKGVERDSNIIVLNQAIAHLKTHMVEAPKWWTESDNGLDLEDIEPVFRLWELLMDAQKPPKEEEKVSETKEQSDS